MPLAVSQIGWTNIGAASTLCTDCTRTGATAQRNDVVSFDANDRANPCDCGRVTGAALTDRSAHSAVATTITAITCLVRRIVTERLGKS